MYPFASVFPIPGHNRSGSAWGLVALADFKSVGVAAKPGRVGSIPTRFRHTSLRGCPGYAPSAHRLAARPDAASTASLIPGNRFAPAARASSFDYLRRLRAPRA
jgi:hypothetical protein